MSELTNQEGALKETGAFQTEGIIKRDEPKIHDNPETQSQKYEILFWFMIQTCRHHLIPQSKSSIY